VAANTRILRGSLIRRLLVLVVLLKLGLPVSIAGQGGKLAEASRGALGDAQKPTEASPASQPAEPATAAIPVEEVAPDSPRASLGEYLSATRSGQWNDAARYLSLSEDQSHRGAELAERLKGVIDRHWIDLETVSTEPGGRRDDGLPRGVEEVGTIKLIEGQPRPLRMVRRSDAKGAFWAFSPATVARIDEWYEYLPNRSVREWLISHRLDKLLLPGPYELLWWQWLAIPLLVLIAWACGHGLSSLTRLIVGRLTARAARGWTSRVLTSIGRPLGLAWGTLLFTVGAVMLALTAPAARFVAHFIAVGLLVALFWALWRLNGVLLEWMTQVSWAADSASIRNLIAVGKNLTRGAIVATGVLALLAALGYPVGTVLAGLGIGGLALAFGAQKTVENIFGSVSLAVDQPFRVGDFVKVEDFVGTVEDIGMRSTRFRTLDRTLISITNGKLSDQRLESFQVRDRMRLATTLGVTYSTTRTQLQAVLEGFERVLRSHPDIWPDVLVVKFKEFGASSLDLEIMAWFQVPTWGDFQRCREEVLLGFMQVVEDAGTSFAFPTRTVHVVNGTSAGLGVRELHQGAESRA